ncbi:protein of unknown function [Alteromonadaceae bacterium Bs31]|nr:protein of unknown function [Alteromonadaceae bacterium Bs31]
MLYSGNTAQQTKWRILLFAFALCSPLAVGGEIVKWVDEHGKVHFGDRVPEKYKKQSEVVDAEAPMLGLTEEELEAQQRLTTEYERQVERNRQREKSEAEKISSEPPAPAPSKAKPKMTREDCRNDHPSITANRVKCFNSLEEDG